jgi:hypothetical protein
MQLGLGHCKIGTGWRFGGLFRYMIKETIMLLKNKIMLVVTCGCLAACAGNAPTATDTQTQNIKAATQTSAQKSNLSAENQEICKVRQITGSRFKQKTCMTAAEWENMARESKNMVDKNTRNKVRHDPG